MGLQITKAVDSVFRTGILAGPFVSAGVPHPAGDKCNPRFRLRMQGDPGPEGKCV